MKLARLFGMIFIFLVLPLMAVAADLSPKQVEGFVGTMKELKPFFDTYSDEVGDDSESTTTSELMSDWTASFKEYKEVQDILKKHNYDMNSWSVVSQQIIQAYMALKLGADGKNVVAEMQDSLKGMESSPDIPAEQKAEIRKQMQKSIAEFEKSLKASKVDQDAVKPFTKQLDELFEWEE